MTGEMYKLGSLQVGKEVTPALLRQLTTVADKRGQATPS